MANISQINGLLLDAATASFAVSASYVTGVSTLSAVQVFRTSSYLLTNTFTDLVFTTHSVQNNPTIVSHSVSNKARIYIGATGLYQVTYHASSGIVAGGGAGGINDYVFQVVKNGNTVISGSSANGRNSSTDVGVASAQTVVELAANDYLTLQTRITGSTAQNSVVYESASFNVIKLDGIVGPQGPAGTGTIGGLDGQIQFNNASSFGGVPTLTYLGGLLRATGSFSGSLTGTSSYASSADLLDGKHLYEIVQASSSAIISGSLTVTGSVRSGFGFTGSLLGTSSWANNAVTASRVLTQTDNTNASYFLTLVDANNGTATEETLLTATGVLVNPALRSLQVQGAMTASTGFLGPLTGSVFGSSSYALTASHALNGGVTSIVAGTNVTISPTNGLGAVTINSSGGGGAAFPFTGSAIISGSLIVTGSVQAGLGGFTGSLFGTASFSANTFTNLKTIRLEMGVSSTTTITTGAKGRKTVSFNGTIVGWRLVADQSTTTTVDIWKANLAIPTVANTITAAAKPALTAAQLSGGTTLTGWTTSVVDGDVFILNVDSNSNATYLSLEIDIVLTNA